MKEDLSSPTPSQHFGSFGLIFRVTSDSDRDAFLSLSREYLVWHLSDIGRYLGHVVDSGPYLIHEETWIAELLTQGMAWIAFDDFGPCGIVAIDLRRGFPEMKRLYVSERGRRTGLGRRLAECAIAAAAQLDQPLIRLDTFVEMTEAIRLYKSLGFRFCDAYFANELPPRLMLAWRFMERETAPFLRRI